MRAEKGDPSKFVPRSSTFTSKERLIIFSKNLVRTCGTSENAKHNSHICIKKDTQGIFRTSAALQLKALCQGILYNGKLSREKTFAFFTVSEPTAKFSPRNFERSAMRMLCVCGCVTHVQGPHLLNNWTGAIRESFLREILVLYRNANVFSLKSLPLYGKC